MSSMYFSRKVMFDKRLQEIKPEIKQGVRKTAKKRRKKARKKRKEKPKLKNVLSGLGNEMTLALLLQLLGRKIDDRGKVEKEAKIKKPRKMRLARGRGIPDTRRREKVKTDYTKKKNETEGAYKTRLNAQLMSNYPQMFLLKELLASKNEKEATTIIDSSVQSGFTTKNINKPMAVIFRLRNELLKPTGDLSRADRGRLKKAIFDTIEGIEPPIVEKFISQPGQAKGTREIFEGVGEAEDIITDITGRAVEARGVRPAVRPYTRRPRVPPEPEAPISNPTNSSIMTGTLGEASAFVDSSRSRSREPTPIPSVPILPGDRELSIQGVSYILDKDNNIIFFSKDIGRREKMGKLDSDEELEFNADYDELHQLDALNDNEEVRITPLQEQGFVSAVAEATTARTADIFSQMGLKEYPEPNLPDWSR